MIRSFFLAIWLIFPLTASAAGCDGAVGDWKWFNGGTATLTQQKTVLMNGKPEGTWSCSDPSHAAISIKWKGGFTDALTVTGNHMAGKNQQGVPVSAERKTAPPHK